jgi:murein DD-endopeptidase MepM/ murein hydrolase activator NlpD
MTEPDDHGPLPPYSGWRPSLRIRSQHVRRLWPYAVVGVVVIILLVGLVVILSRPRPTTVPLRAAEPAPDTAVRTTSCAVRPGEVMSVFLARADVGTDDAARIISALRTGGFNFRRMRPGDSLVVVSGPVGLERVDYHQSFERVWRVALGAAEPRVSMLYRRITERPALIIGDIATSLYEALVALGETPALISGYADIFGWEVDFFCETQEHDSFAVLVDKRYCDSAFIGYGRIRAARYRGAVGDFRAFRFLDPDGRDDCYNEHGECLRKTFLKSPLSFSRVTSFFGSRYHPIRRVRAEHQGVDYAAPRGTPVSCVADGRVVSAGWAGGYGNLVEVRHTSGLTTRYGHLSGFGRGIRAGVEVSQGQVVGYVGTTGMSTGPHLHYEVRRNGSPVNPLRLDVPRVEPVNPAYLAQFEALRDSIVAAVPALAAATPPPPPAPAPN